MVAQLKQLEGEAQRELDEHRGVKAFLTKLGKDNIGMLAAFVSWSLLTSMIPIIVGLVAISSLFLHTPSAQATVISHLYQALRGALSASEIKAIVHGSAQHSGLLGIIGFLGVLWGGSNVGGSFSTAFQAIFEVPGRSFIKEKLLDIGMIFVFTALMLIIVAATAAGAFLDKLFSGFPLPGVGQFIIGTAISLIAAFVLFAAIFTAFPNIQPRFRLQHVWQGALVSAVLFQILNYVWPLYASFSHFQRYGAILVPLLVLTAWIYFFAMIAMIGSEVVAVGAIREAQAKAKAVGPPPGESTPQHKVLRGGSPEKTGAAPPSDGRRHTKTGNAPTANRTTAPATSKSHPAPPVVVTEERPVVSDQELERDPAFWLMAGTPLVVAALAAVSEMVGHHDGGSGS